MAIIPSTTYLTTAMEIKGTTRNQETFPITKGVTKYKKTNLKLQDY